MDKSFLILSPHCDDIPLSIGASLLAKGLGTDIRVVIVFSRSRYTKFERGIAALQKTTRLRRSEEKQAGRAAGYQVSFLPFSEPFARPGYSALDDIFDQTRAVNSEFEWEPVHETLWRVMEAHNGMIMGPLGCGGHIDHRIVTYCYREFIQSSRVKPPIFYEDLPYAASLSSQEIVDLIPNSYQGTTLIPVITAVSSLEDKLSLLKLYKSQLTEDYIEAVQKHWLRRRGHEVLWTTDSVRRERSFESINE